MNENQGSIGFFWSEWMESAVEMWLSAVRAWQPPCEMTEAFMRILGPVGGGHEIFEWLWNSGESTGQSLENFKQEAVNSWMSIYETAFQPLLKMPQVGITRVYQEKINRLADKFQSYQKAVSEFQMLLSVPMEKSFIEMKDEVEKLRAKSDASDDAKAYYGTWIKVLENHYMSLFRSEEYRAALSRLLDETAAFRVSGNDVMEEFLEFLPIPTNREMDELYKELYLLKKQNKEAIKKIGRLESTLAKKDVQ